MFQRAEKKKVKLRMSLAGISGSGKTYSALCVATGIGGKIAVIDTEAGRANLYANEVPQGCDKPFEYDVCELAAPFTPSRYVEIIKKAEGLGYTTIIIDSLSHAWAGEGGVLSIVEQNGGTFNNGWRKGTPQHNLLIEAILQSKCHIILTMRAKSEYVIEMTDKGKQAPRKVGMAAVQRDQLDFEMICAADMNLEHQAHFTKDNTNIFDQQYVKLSVEMGQKIKQWLDSGIDEKEDFIKNKLDQIIDKVNSCKTLIELQAAYTVVHKLYADKFPDEFMKVIEAKDHRKADMMIVKEENAA